MKVVQYIYFLMVALIVNLIYQYSADLPLDKMSTFLIFVDIIVAGVFSIIFNYKEVTSLHKKAQL